MKCYRYLYFIIIFIFVNFCEISLVFNNLLKHSAFFILKNNMTPFELFVFIFLREKSLSNAKICYKDGILNTCYPFPQVRSDYIAV